jgi:hypothetical protein
MPDSRRIPALVLLALAGSLASAAPTLASQLTPSSSPVEFGTTEVHSGGSPSQNVLFTNESASATTVQSAQIIGPDAAEFSIEADYCTGKTQSSGWTCEVRVNFLHRSSGAKHATLELLETSGPVEVALLGTGVTGTLSAEPTPLSFPATVDGHGGETKQVTVANANASTYVASVEIAGPDASSFSLAYGSCPQDNLSQNNTCEEGVRFSPTSPGEKGADLVVSSDATNSTFIIPVSGSGASGPHLSLDSDQALLGEVLVGSTMTHTFTATNTGDYPLEIQGAFVVSGTPSMFPIISDTCSGKAIAAGASCDITVNFQPSTPGQKDASIIILTESTGAPTAVGIDGIGVLSSGAASPLAAIGIPLTVPRLPGPTGALVARPRLFRLPPHRSAGSVNTGMGASCPSLVVLCRIRTTIMTSRLSSPSRASRLGIVKDTPMSLGSMSSSLQAGQSVAVYGRLSSSGIALISHRHKLKVTITITITVPGESAIIRSRTFILTRKSGARLFLLRSCPALLGD